MDKAFRSLTYDHEHKERLNKACLYQLITCRFWPHLQMVNDLEKIWSTVGYRHEYISPTWPASLSSAGSTTSAIVTPYYRNGSILEYAHRNPSHDYFHIVLQLASVLAYIHSKGVVHGNVCPVSSDSSSVHFWFLVRQYKSHADKGRAFRRTYA